MVRHLSHAGWIAKTLKEASSLPGLLHVDIYITGPAKSSINNSGTEIEKPPPSARNWFLRSMNQLTAAVQDQQIHWKHGLSTIQDPICVRCYHLY
jgi:hypothetical protein